MFTASFFVPTLLYLKSKNGKLCTDTPLFCHPAVLCPCPSLIHLCQCSICLLAVTNSPSCGCQDLTLPAVRVLICSVFLCVMKWEVSRTDERICSYTEPAHHFVVSGMKYQIIWILITLSITLPWMTKAVLHLKNVRMLV